MEDHSFLDSPVVGVRAFRVVVPPRRDSRSLHQGARENSKASPVIGIFRRPTRSQGNSINAVEEPVDFNSTSWGVFCLYVVLVLVLLFALPKDSSD